MLPHHRRRQDFAAGNHFSFSSPASDYLEYDTWAENLKTPDNSFGKRNPHPKFGPWTRTTRLPHSTSVGEGSYDAFSPPLWKSASPESRPNISRAQMIAKYRQEMLDLVRDLPETAYELSLRDIVESKPTQRREEEEEEEEEEAALTERWDMRKGRGKRRVRSSSRNGSTGSGGFLLKLFMPSIPAVLGGRRKISPKPMAAGADRDWSSEGYGERSSSNGSSDSSCSGRGRQIWKLGSCYSCFYRHRRSRSREF